MHGFKALVALALAAVSFAAPAVVHSVVETKDAVPGQYIVKLKPGFTVDDLGPHTMGDAVTATWSVINGFAAALTEDELNILRTSPIVELITQDGMAYALGSQNNAPWGLQRVQQKDKVGSPNSGLVYNYNWPETAGTEVDAYVIDTGIHVTHVAFEGRARWGTSLNYAQKDGNGHGTHCAGTIGSSLYGIAKNVNLIAVKVLSDGGSGTWSDVISGMDWVRNEAIKTGRASLVSMSLGGGSNQAIDDAIAALTAAGVHAVVAAGNSNDDAQWYSPARAPSAITVGASDIDDARAYFSNYGTGVDVFAPGVDIISTWTGASNTAINSISGTSMATPHVAGVVALLISQQGNDTPANMEAKIKSLANKGVLTDIPEGTFNAILQVA